MKKTGFKKVGIILLGSFIMPLTLFAHSGRTDSNGGHKDNKNKSGLGSYHYHCGGYPAHLHDNGVCPYDSSATVASTTKTASSSQAKATTPTYTEKVSTFVIDGKATQINTVNANGTNLVELRTLCDELGIAMVYDPTMKTIECTKGDTLFLLQIDSQNMWVNNTELRTLDVAPIAYKGKTMVPARAVAEVIGKVVTFDAENGQIVIQ